MFNDHLESMSNRTYETKTDEQLSKAQIIEPGLKSELGLEANPDLDCLLTCI